jgi:hypothetical protein
MVTTNVPQPTFGPQGFIEPAQSAILVGVQQDMQNAFGGSLNFTTSGGSLTNATPQGQWSASLAALIGQTNDTFLFQSTQTDPSFAEGRWQDAIGNIYFIQRNPASPTTLLITATGAVGTLIPIGSTVQDPSGNIYTSLASGVIGSNGTVSISFAANTYGSGVQIPTSVSIFQAISGWDTATIVSATQGQATESRGAFETRRSLATEQNSIGSLPSILGAVLVTPGVATAYVTENVSGTAATVGGVTLQANSVYVAAVGGSDAAVAHAIWSRKAPGCNYSGNTTVVVQDTSPGYNPPFPSYNVTFERPANLQILFNISMVNNTLVPSNATTLIQQAIQGAMVGNDGGPAVTIGGYLPATRFVTTISALGTWAAGSIRLIQIGSLNNPDVALASGSSGGTLLTVSSWTSGTISAGDTVLDGSGIILPGTTIVAGVSGTGRTGTYTINQPNTFTTEGLWFSSADQSSVQAFINQYPVASANNISVAFS